MPLISKSTQSLNVRVGGFVAHSVDNPEHNRCVDIIQISDRNFRFQEWRREPEDISGWFLMLDSAPRTFTSMDEAITAAKRAITWFDDLI